MSRTICLVILFYSFIYPQIDGTNYQDLNSPSNIKKFADYLFCTSDYLRAANEYKKYLNIHYNDTVEFKTGLSYSIIGDNNQAIIWFDKIKDNSRFFYAAREEYLKSLFQLGNYNNFRSYFPLNTQNEEIKIIGEKLYNFSYLFTDNPLPLHDDFLEPFNSEEKEIVKEFYQRKVEPPNKNIAIAAIMSALIPGSGKIYTGEIGDGIIAAMTTGLCAYLAYDNFKAKHNFRGWLFSGLSVFFYAGDIYGSAASAQIYNAGIQFDFVNDVKFYLNKKNYFIPEYEFCK